ncbi:MAG: AI-2E family transporter [Anaerolineales bacterium]
MPEITSPPWQPGTRLMVAGLLALSLALLIFAARQIMAPLVLALLLAYILHPLVNHLQRWTKMSRRLAVAIVYFLLVILLGGATTGIGLAITQQLIGIVRDLTVLVEQLPEQLDALSQATIAIGPWSWDLGQVNLDPLVNSLVSTVQPLLSRTGTILASAVTSTATTVAMLVIVLVMGYYLLRDFDQIEGSFLEMVPPDYREDFAKLLDETGRVWSSFLRGQLILALVMGVGSAVIYGSLGVRFALGLGLITGFMEFIPIFGPYIAGVVAVLLALFQAANYWGLSAGGFALLILIVAVIIQQIENTILVPSIIGHSLKLHPLIVLVAAITGGLLAGFLGILLAAPTVASLRVWIGYVYRKAIGLESWPSPVVEPQEESASEPFRHRVQRWLSKLPGTTGEGDEKPDPETVHADSNSD